MISAKWNFFSYVWIFVTKDQGDQIMQLILYMLQIFISGVQNWNIKYVKYYLSNFRWFLFGIYFVLVFILLRLC